MIQKNQIFLAAASLCTPLFTIAMLYDNNYALKSAIQRPDKEIVQKLLNAKTDVNKLLSLHLLAHTHSKRRNENRIHASGIPIREASGENMHGRAYQLSLLLKQIDLTYTAIATALLKAKAEVNTQDDEHGETALHECIRHNNPVLAKLLLEQGADPLLKNKQGLTPKQLMSPWLNNTPIGILLRNAESKLQEVNVDAYLATQYSQKNNEPCYV